MNRILVSKPVTHTFAWLTIAAMIAISFVGFGVHEAGAAAACGDFDLKWGSNGSADGQMVVPFDVAINSSGDVYVSDLGNSRVQKFDSNGNFLLKWGTNGSADGQFSGMGGISVDSSGNVYVADRGNARVQKFDSNGNFLLKWGTSGSADGQFLNMQYVEVDSSDNVYTTENYRVQKFDSNGNFIMKFGSFGPADGQLLAPHGVAIDSAGNIYVADPQRDDVQKFDSSGTFITKWASPEAKGIAVDSNDDIYVGTDANDKVQKFNSSGSLILEWGTGGSGDGEFDAVSGLDISPVDDSAYVADVLNHRIQKFTCAGPLVCGDFLEVYPGVSAFNPVFDIDSSGDVYMYVLLNATSGTLSKVSAAGALQWSTTIGRATDVAVDEGAGILYVTQGSTSVADSSVAKYAASNGAAMGPLVPTGVLAGPRGIAIDGDGDIWVAWNTSQQVKAYDASGTAVPGKGFNLHALDVDVDSAGNVFTTQAGIAVWKHTPNGTALGQISVPSNPQWLTVDSEDDVIFGDASHQVYKYDGSDMTTLLAQWGGNGTGDGEFSGFAVGDLEYSGTTVYATDLGGQRIQKFFCEGETDPEPPVQQCTLDALDAMGIAPGTFPEMEAALDATCNDTDPGNDELEIITTDPGNIMLDCPGSAVIAEGLTIGQNTIGNKDCENSLFIGNGGTVSGNVLKTSDVWIAGTGNTITGHVNHSVSLHVGPGADVSIGKSINDIQTLTIGVGGTVNVGQTADVYVDIDSAGTLNVNKDFDCNGLTGPPTAQGTINANPNNCTFVTAQAGGGMNLALILPVLALGVLGLGIYLKPKKS